MSDAPPPLRLFAPGGEVPVSDGRLVYVTEALDVPEFGATAPGVTRGDGWADAPLPFAAPLVGRPLVVFDRDRRQLVRAWAAGFEQTEAPTVRVDLRTDGRPFDVPEGWSADHIATAAAVEFDGTPAGMAAYRDWCEDFWPGRFTAAPG